MYRTIFRLKMVVFRKKKKTNIRPLSFSRRIRRKRRKAMSRGHPLPECSLCRCGCPSRKKREYCSVDRAHHYRRGRTLWTPSFLGRRRFLRHPVCASAFCSLRARSGRTPLILGAKRHSAHRPKKACPGSAARVMRRVPTVIFQK